MYDTQPFSMKKTVIQLLAVITGMFVVILDSTVVNVALKKLIEDMHSDISTMQWTVTGYTLALAAVIPLAGWLIDRFGAKQVFLLTILFFTLGSVLCAFAKTPEQLILFRIVQGVGGGMVSPIGFAIVFRVAPPHKIGAVMGTLGVPVLLAPAIGPVIAGYFVEFQTWQWIFLINLPIGILTIFLGMKFLPKLETKTVPKLDILGIILAPIAFSMLAFGVSQSDKGWTHQSTLTGLIVGGIALILFIFVELKQEHPLLELRVFKSAGFTLGVLTTWAMQIALFGLFTIVPLFLQYVKGFGPLKTGWVMFPQAIASGLMMPIGGKLYDKVGARPLGAVGLGIITISMVLFSNISSSSSTAFVILCLVLMGIGMGLSMMAINTHVLQSAPHHLVNRVTPLTTAAQQVMVSFAVAGMTSFLASRVVEHTSFVESKKLVEGVMYGGADAVKDMLDITTINKVLSGIVDAYGDTFLLAAGIALVGWLLVLTLKKPNTAPGADKDQANASMMSGH